ncbi:hypothetical protein OAI44_03730 [Oceanospirillaceae bacterium]|nr:hypothetical protein [Oceanospirillaceae bacterium]
MKILKWIMKAVVALVTIITLIVLFADDLEHTYNKLTWTPPMEINGIAIGMTRSDVVFKLGEPECFETRNFCWWGNHFIWFKNDMVDAQTSQNQTILSMPFNDTKGMKLFLGDEDIISVTKDFNLRRYTYLKWGATFAFMNDVLVEYTQGFVEWRSTANSVGKYIVKGTVVCPGTECPFDEEGDVKEDFKDRDYTYFIK